MSSNKFNQSNDRSAGFLAGAAQAEITPAGPVYLHGYPHVPRISTGVHDPLLCSALYLSDGTTAVVLVGHDLLFMPHAVSDRARLRLTRSLGIPADHLLLTASHTHSGPVTFAGLTHRAEQVAPPPDPAYLQTLEDRIVHTVQRATHAATPAELVHAIADGSALGTNRHDPVGPAIPQMPVLLARARADRAPIALTTVCSMHPTVLHEDSTLISGDFPGLARRHLQASLLAPDKPLVHHIGAAGNQSPRHVTRANTFAEMHT